MTSTLSGIILGFPLEKRLKHWSLSQDYRHHLLIVQNNTDHVILTFHVVKAIDEIEYDHKRPVYGQTVTVVISNVVLPWLKVYLCEMQLWIYCSASCFLLSLLLHVSLFSWSFRFSSSKYLYVGIGICRAHEGQIHHNLAKNKNPLRSMTECCFLGMEISSV